MSTGPNTHDSGIEVSNDGAPTGRPSDEQESPERVDDETLRAQRAEMERLIGLARSTG